MEQAALTYLDLLEGKDKEVAGSTCEYIVLSVPIKQMANSIMNFGLMFYRIYMNVLFNSLRFYLIKKVILEIMSL